MMEMQSNRQRLNIQVRAKEIQATPENRSTYRQGTGSQTNKPYRPPVHTLTTGLVATRIWKNVDEANYITWRVDQRRIRIHGQGGTACKSFGPEHIDDAICGLRLAREWIEKQTKKRDRGFLANLLSR